MREVYEEGEPFSGLIGRTASESSAAWPSPRRPGSEARNLLMIVLDDLGFGQLGCYGGLGGRVKTPHIDALAGGGLRYNNFHVSPMCSPTRAALLSGRNSHSVGVGKIMESVRGFPGQNGRIPKETALLPAVLAEQGFTCYALGKWHLTPGDEVTPIGPFDRWPLGVGFHRFYGFHLGNADHWNPILWEDNHCIGKPALNREGYHLSEDLAARAIAWTDEHEAIAPARPYFLYLAFGAMHQPHHVASEWSEPFRGAFEAGWDVIRAENLEVQKQIGVVPDETLLPPPNEGVPAWRELDKATRALMERQMEVYAGFLAHTDFQIGRVLEHLRARGSFERTLTILLSDNGSSGEGGPFGKATTTPGFNGVPETREETLSLADEWGGPTTYPNYSTGWAMAGNSPNRWYKQFAHEGGTRAPLIVHWPERIGGQSEIRGQFHAAPDVLPTVLELFGMETPKVVAGITQRAFEGTSFAYSVDDAEAATRKVSQYFEMFGHRAIWSRGWKAVAAHWTSESESMFLGTSSGSGAAGSFDDDDWELYHLDEDFSECRNLAAEYPQVLSHLIELWWSEAGRFGVLPLDDHMGFRTVSRVPQVRAHQIFEERERYTYRSRVSLTPSVSPNLRNRSYSIAVRCGLAAGSQGGVILSDGGVEGGYSLCVLDGAVHFVSNYLGREITVASTKPVSARALEIFVSFEKTNDHEGKLRIRANSLESKTIVVPHTNPVCYDLRGGGLRVGADYGGVWSRYATPFAFEGNLEEVTISCYGPEYRDHARELQMHLSEQ